MGDYTTKLPHPRKKMRFSSGVWEAESWLGCVWCVLREVSLASGHYIAFDS